MSYQKHYDEVLAKFYTWALGGLSPNIEKNLRFFDEHLSRIDGAKSAIDLGCGSGFQTLALEQLGYRTIAIDTSKKLLGELEIAASPEWVVPILGDLRDFKKWLSQKVDVIVCMGDTLSHLPALEDVNRLIENAASSLRPHGQLVLSYRDLSQSLSAEERIIPVKSDANCIFTCFLEPAGEHVTVNDVIYERSEGEWQIYKSSYSKLIIPVDYIVEAAKIHQMSIQKTFLDEGMIYLPFNKAEA